MTPIKVADLPFAGSSTRFEGGGHGSSISFFLSRFAPGGGPRLHRHPYDETFIIEAGTARFTAGDATFEAVAGEVVVVPPNTPHKFVNTGDDELVQVSIHAAPAMVQEDLE
jgi:quercetin dioxygenase-like cupin family protein